MDASRNVSVRLLTYNIREGGTGRVKEIAEVIRAADPDFVALQEAGDPDVVARVATLVGFDAWGSRAGYSTGFLTRLRVSSHEWHHPPRTRHAILDVQLGDDMPRIFVIHLRAWFSNWSERHRTRELRGLLDGIQDDLGKDGDPYSPHLIAGDFNALAPDEMFSTSTMPAWIRGMMWLSGQDIARTTVQLMRDRGYVDAWRAMHPDLHEQPGYTFPVWNPHVRLDYVFAPVKSAARVHACEVVRSPEVALRASDHFPLLVDFA